MKFAAKLFYLYLRNECTPREESMNFYKCTKDKNQRGKFSFKDIVFIVIGIAGIILGGQLVVNGATKFQE